MHEDDEDPFMEPITSLSFPGRLSSVMPREDDPEVVEEPMSEEAVENYEPVDPGSTPELSDDAPQIDEVEETAESIEAANIESEQQNEDIPEDAAEPEPEPMSIDQLTVMQDAADAAEAAEAAKAAEIASEQQRANVQNSAFQLRAKDADECHDLSAFEDDCTKSFVIYDDQSPAKNNRRETLGLSALADQLGSWSAASPVKMDHQVTEVSDEPATTSSIGTPNVNQHATTPHNYFEQEMIVRRESLVAQGSKVAESVPVEIDEPEIEDLPMTDEDMELAQEAEELAMGSPEAQQMTHSRSFDDSLSDASQEYMDENEMPIDPALSSPVAPHAVPVTPLRPVNQTFNTTTKVPLKPADYSTPSPIKKRSFSASRAQSKSKRPSSSLARNATVISHSPSKSQQRSKKSNEEKLSAPSTPASAKSDILSTMGTPARTPRRDLNPALLRGAVVFVDVHTSEGAEANGIFVELLTQMGAKCLKSWSWNPNSQENNASADRIGITHMVYKDGGKRNLEKVRQSNGVVQCVGVSWVLE